MQKCAFFIKKSQKKRRFWDKNAVFLKISGGIFFNLAPFI